MAHIRQWHSVADPYMLDPNGAAGLEFTVMSYNVLAQTLMERHPYLYRFCVFTFTFIYYTDISLDTLDRDTYMMTIGQQQGRDISSAL